MANIFEGFSYIRFVGYLELHRVPPIMRGSPICVGYLEAPLFVRGTSNHVEHLGLFGVPQIALESFHWSTRGALLPFLFFPQTTSP